MKHLISPICITLCLSLIIGCKNKTADTSATTPASSQNTTSSSSNIETNSNGQNEEDETPKIVLAKGTLASDKDPVCGMNAYKYLHDTATVNGKLYGFCSPECKDEYVKAN